MDCIGVAWRRARLLAMVLCALSDPLMALTWDFVDSRQGWVALGESSNDRYRLMRPDALVDGIWEITAPSPFALPKDGVGYEYFYGVELHSPPIGYDSELFDTVRIRLRLLHSAPAVGSLSMRWTNAEFPHDEPTPSKPRGHHLYVLREERTISDEWSEWVLPFIRFAKDANWPISWNGELIDLRLTVGWRSYVGDVVEPPRLQVDYITLTGTEEQLLSEPLPVPGEDLSLPPPGRLFHPAVYHPVRKGLSSLLPYMFGERSQSALMDVNRNGSLDFVSFWNDHWQPAGETTILSKQGWVVALNDGDGAFTPRLEHSYGSYAHGTNLLAADLTGDGWPELITSRGLHLEVSRFDAELNREVLLAMDHDQSRFLLGAGDITGDGASELIVQDWAFPHTVEAWSFLQDGFAPVSRYGWERVNLRPLTARRFSPWRPVEILWGAAQAPWGSWVLSPVNPTGEASAEAHLITDFTPYALLWAGDLTGDGRIELVSTKDQDSYYDTSRAALKRGLRLWQEDGDGQMTATSWFDASVTVSGRVWTGDLHGDGYADVVFVHDNPARGYAVVVARGQEHGLPQEEGWYPITGHGGGGQILAGDVTNDGAVDLVVVDRSLGGVHVLKSRLAEEPVTAVHEPAAVRPTGVHLGPNYPNPFNPHTSIPFTLAAADAVRLQVYDLRGRLVRTLWDGPLAAGPHRLDWDGRNAAGRPVASGVYLYRLEVGGQVHSRKLLKLQ